MYFSKKYWQVIKRLYKFKKISSFDLKSIGYNQSSCIPYVFKDLVYIFVHTGKLLKIINFNKLGKKIFYLNKNGK